MSIFSEHILKLLNDYKRSLRRYLSNSEREKMIINLGLKRKSLKFDSDVILYNKAHRVLKDIEYWTQKHTRVATEYSGIDEFYQHLKNYLSHYQIENNRLVHITQKVSCALVQAIQLISLPEPEFSDSNALKLDNCLQTIIKFGSKDQCLMLAKAFYKQKNAKNSFFTPMVENFIKNHFDLIQEYL